jgi:hypothetical protein
LNELRFYDCIEEAEAGEFEFKSSLGYIGGSRPARAI